MILDTELSLGPPTATALMRALVMTLLCYSTLEIVCVLLLLLLLAELLM